MTRRAKSSGITLTENDAALIKGMLVRGDRQHDIAACFGVNGGRIAEISTGHSFASITPAQPTALPPQGPYPRPYELIQVLEELKSKTDNLLKGESHV